MDEMDLARQALAVTPWRPETYEQARTALAEAMAESGVQPEAPVLGRRVLGTRGKIGIGAGIGAVAAAAAVALAVSLPGTGTSVRQHPRATGSASPAPAANPVLAVLAARISATAGSQPGNASLEIVRQTIGGKLMQVYYGLFTDSGKLYSGDDKQTLVAAIAHHSNQADSADFREMAAARYAVAGNLATARTRMINATPNCLGLGLSTAAQKKIWAKCQAGAEVILREKGVKRPPEPDSAKNRRYAINNSLWTNGADALNWGGGDPGIRAGVLRLLSTISAVTVVKSTTHGQPTLTITAGPAVFGGAGKEVLTVNAKTGLPVSSVSTTPGVAAGVETYRVSRVTLASIEAGRF